MPPRRLAQIDVLRIGSEHLQVEADSLREPAPVRHAKSSDVSQSLFRTRSGFALSDWQQFMTITAILMTNANRDAMRYMRRRYYVPFERVLTCIKDG